MDDAVEKLIFPKSYLAQGDIFKYNVVAPLGDHDVRILRTVDGRHGSCIFEFDEPYKIFDIEDLTSTLSTKTDDPLRTQPFHLTHDNQKEMVVVYGDLLQFFVIASQTCDICGVDKPPKALSAIIAYRSLLSFCMHERLRISAVSNKGTTIEIEGTIIELIRSKTDTNLAVHDAFEFPKKLRESLQQWKPVVEEDKIIKGKIKGFLNALADNKNNSIYYIQPSPELGVPEGYADFTQITTVSTGMLADLKGDRIATLGPAYNAQFAEKLGLFISRIATPIPMRGDQF